MRTRPRRARPRRLSGRSTVRGEGGIPRSRIAGTSGLRLSAPPWSYFLQQRLSLRRSDATPRYVDALTQFLQCAIVLNDHVGAEGALRVRQLRRDALVRLFRRQAIALDHPSARDCRIDDDDPNLIDERRPVG